MQAEIEKKKKQVSQEVREQLAGNAQYVAAKFQNMFSGRDFTPLKNTDESMANILA
jgi:hypothetical protein